MSVFGAVARRHNLWAGAFWLVSVVFACSATSVRAEHLKLGNEGVYPPFSVVDSNGHLTGIEPDWARECANA